MKYLTSLILIFSCITCFSQQEEFVLEGQVLDSTSHPVSDAYILNFRTQKLSISKPNGIFEISVLPGDSLVIAHLAFIRKKVNVFNLLKNPVIILQPDQINIPQVDVSPNRKTDYDLARKNMASLTEIKPVSYTKIKVEQQPAMQVMTENNRNLRNEAASVTLLRFSPSEKIGQLFKKLKKKNSE